MPLSLQKYSYAKFVYLHLEHQTLIQFIYEQSIFFKAVYENEEFYNPPKSQKLTK